MKSHAEQRNTEKPPAECLRERRHRILRQEIKAVTLRLALAHGYDHVTVEMISAQAGISPRTFFNHFSSKDEAVLTGPPTPPEQAAAAFVAAGPAAPRAVLADLLRLLIAGLSESPPEREAMRDLYELTRGHPVLLAGMLARFAAAETALALTVAERLGPEAPEELPALLAALALTTVRTGLERWSAAPCPPGQDTVTGQNTVFVQNTEAADSPVGYVERAAATLDALFCPSGASVG